MAFTEKLKWFILPALVVIGIGVLEINFPHAMDGYDLYRGHGDVGLVLLLFQLLLWLTWGKITGTIVILLGIMAIAICLLPNSQRVEEKPVKSPTSNDGNDSGKKELASFALRTGKNYIQKKLNNRQP